MFKRLCLILLMLIPLVVCGQPSHYAVSITSGRIIPVNGSRYQGVTPTIGAAAQILWQQPSTDYWQHFWHNPFFGIHCGFAHIEDDLVGERRELGGVVLTPLTKHLFLDYKIGLSFYTDPYSRTHNEDNIFIGSYVNALLAVALRFNVTTKTGLHISLGAGIVHSSSGYLSKPNHGLNYLQSDLSFMWPSRSTAKALEQTKHSDTRADSSLFIPAIRPYLSVAPALVMSRNDAIDDNKYYFAYTLQGGAILHPHPCFSAGCNIDIMYNYAHKSSALEGEAGVYFGASLFGEAHWGRFTLRAGAGRYLDYYPQNWEQWYLRGGAYWNITSRQRIGAAMKLHYDHIDYIEWTYMIEL